MKRGVYMKKLFSILLILGVMYSNSFACLAFDFASEIFDDTNEFLKFPQLNRESVYEEINGKKFFVNYSHMTKYDEGEYDFFVTQENCSDYIWTGEYYFARSTAYEGPALADYKISDWVNSIKLFDKDFNLVKEHQFEHRVYSVFYYNGTYYCNMPYLYKDEYGYPVAGYMTSADFESWQDFKGEIEVSDFGVFRSYNLIDEVSFDGQNFYTISNENKNLGNRIQGFGEWIARKDNESSNDDVLYLSNDNIYFLKLQVPGVIYNDRNLKGSFDPMKMYEQNNELVVETDAFILHYDPETNESPKYEFKYIRFTTPKQPIYDKLEQMKNTVYVRLNDEILGFEVAPVIEAGRTLVPMRFLFEQMGEEVLWDGAAQSATVIGRTGNITFSIDNTTANVNGEDKTMDVPARLINDKTMVPLRFLSEALGYNVEWDEESNMAIITQ